MWSLQSLVDHCFANGWPLQIHVRTNLGGSTLMAWRKYQIWDQCNANGCDACIRNWYKHQTPAQIIIKPLLEDGLLLYSGHHEYGDYISLCLNMGYVEFTFDLGSGPATVRYVWDEPWCFILAVQSVFSAGLGWAAVEPNILLFYREADALDTQLGGIIKYVGYIATRLVHNDAQIKSFWGGPAP